MHRSLVGRDLVKVVTTPEAYEWTQGPWKLGGYTTAEDAAAKRGGRVLRVVAYDFGIKYNILRNLVGSGCSVRVVPASTPGTWGVPTETGERSDETSDGATPTPTPGF